MFNRVLIAVLLLLTLAAAGSTRAQTTTVAPNTPPDPKEMEFPAWAVGVQLDGPSLLLLTVKGDVAENISFGTGLSYRPMIIEQERKPGEDKDETEFKYYNGFFIPIEGTLWLQDGNGGEKGPNRHGIGMMAGYGFGDFSEVDLAVYYDYERYKDLNHVYNASVGLMLSKYLDLPDMPVEDDDNLRDDVTYISLYFRFAWRWEPFESI